MSPVSAPPRGTIWLVFNELSARVTADNVGQGRERLDDLVDAMATVMNGRPAELICVGENVLWDAELATGYTVGHWFASADRDRRMLLVGIATKTSFPDEAGEALKERFYLSEFRLDDINFDVEERLDARGLGAAFLLDGIAVSLPSEERWMVTSVPLRHVWLDERGIEDSRNIQVLNMSGSNEAQDVYDAIVERTQRDLWGAPTALASRKRECFPHLRFGRDVDEHIAKLPTGIITAVVHKLMDLDHASRTWRRNSHTAFPTLPGCRTESEATMQKYGHHRVFRDAQGISQTYPLHCTLASRRMHLRVVHKPRSLEIGYIGKHLPTKKHH